MLLTTSWKSVGIPRHLGLPERLSTGCLPCWQTTPGPVQTNSKPTESESKTEGPWGAMDTFLPATAVPPSHCKNNVVLLSTELLSFKVVAVSLNLLQIGFYSLFLSQLLSTPTLSRLGTQNSTFLLPQPECLKREVDGVLINQVWFFTEKLRDWTTSDPSSYYTDAPLDVTGCHPEGDGMASVCISSSCDLMRVAVGCRLWGDSLPCHCSEWFHLWTLTRVGEIRRRAGS